ncbi:MAG: diphosphomevalonate decarboxylase [Polyangiaceae bacterium]|jgi:diphosphomevalonate decarboxylase
MKSEASVVAHPNIALSKYWGKREGRGRFPAVPSLSVTLAGLATRTRVRFDDALEEDRLTLNDSVVVGPERERAVELLDRVRAVTRDARKADIVSTNDFPTASGLASSASGFAALALAAVRAADLDWDAPRVSDLARRSSASAARSVFGGYVELASAPLHPPDDHFLAAHSVAPADHLPIVVFVCVTTEQPKAIGSTDGMRLTLTHSPYARAWLDEAPRLHGRLREALLGRDFPEVGRLAEASALAMHASAMAAGVVYWTAATLDLLAAVRSMRAGGIDAFATIDAGPHVKVLAMPCDAERLRAALPAVPGVRRVVETRPGEGARVDDGEARQP